MTRFLKTSFLSFLLLGLLHSTSANPPNEKEIAKKVLMELGNLPGIVGEAFKLYETFGNVFKIVTAEETLDTDDRLNMMNEKLEQLSSDLKSFEDRLSDKLEHMNEENKLDAGLKEMTDYMDNVDYYYRDFVDYSNESQHFFDSDLPLLVRQILDDHPITIDLEKMHKAFESTPGTSKNIPMLLRIPSIAQDYMCTLRQTSQQTINIFYQRILLTEVKAYAMLIFAYEFRKISHEVKETSHHARNMKHFEERMSKAFEIVKKNMAIASRELWKCDESKSQIEGTHYARVGPVFQKYVLDETGASYTPEGDTIGCTYTCEDFKNVKHHLNGGGHFRHHCFGNVRNCETRTGDPMEYCIAKDGYRKYTYIKYGNETFGENKGCGTVNGIFNQPVVQWRFAVRCYYCLCTCESNDVSIDRYFSLRPVQADHDANKVVVSARLRLENNIFHIQIKQGKLLPAGRVQPDDEWTPVHKFKIGDRGIKVSEDYYEVTWDTKKVLLDDIYAFSNTSEENRVLTGLRFEQVDDQLRLGIYLSKFDYATGQVGETSFHVNKRKADERSLISMDGLDVPNTYKNNKKRSRDNEYLEFTTSDLKKDAGQNVLPFIDIEPVESYPFSPLSGAGLFLRADDRIQSGGYLALKLFTLDTTPYMKKLKLGEKVPISPTQLG